MLQAYLFSRNHHILRSLGTEKVFLRQGDDVFGVLHVLLLRLSQWSREPAKEVLEVKNFRMMNEMIKMLVMAVTEDI